MVVRSLARNAALLAIKYRKGLATSLNSAYSSYPRVSRDQLPKPPVPPLDDSLDRYLGYASAVGSDADYANTQLCVAEFRDNEGPRLQAQLQQIAKQRENWASEYWIKDMYLSVRFALPINSNPAYVFPKQSFSNFDDMLRFSAHLVSEVCSFKNELENRKLPVDRSTGKQGGASFCMEQYWRMFTSYRKPVLEVDEQITDARSPEGSEHFVMLFRGHPYVITTMLNHQRLSSAEVYRQLVSAVEHARAQGDSRPMALLTAVERNMAATGMEMLEHDLHNASCLEQIRNGAFMLCLDEVSRSLDTPEEQALHIMHGGELVGVGNRWFDKTNQLVVCTDGTNGVNFEHSVAEGIVLVTMVESTLAGLQDKLLKKDFLQQGNVETIEPRHLDFRSFGRLDTLLEECKQIAESSASDVQLRFIKWNEYGKSLAKSVSISPDAFFQMVIQLAHYRTHGYLVSTYESASVRRFRFGRVDNIRAAHPQAKAWARAMTDEGVSLPVRQRLFKQAIDKQTEVMRQNVTGYGIDNHLYTLLSVSKENGDPKPSMFNDPHFDELFRFPMSTSQVPTTIADTYCCYGPVTPDGYGCCYNPREDCIIFAISAFASHPRTDIDRFSAELVKTLEDMGDFLSSMQAPS